MELGLKQVLIRNKRYIFDSERKKIMEIKDVENPTEELYIAFIDFLNEELKNSINKN